MTVFLLCNIAALLMGPALIHLLAKRMVAFRFIDAFVLVAVCGLILLHVLPESFAMGGVFTLVAAAFGFCAPLVMGSLLRDGHCQIHRSLVSIATLGLFAHSLLDGMALAGTNHGHSQDITLALAIVLHRLPEGVGIWRISRFRVGPVGAVSLLVLVGLATIIGFFFGTQVVSLVSEHSLVLFQALMAGILLHVIFHKRHLPEMHHNDPLIDRRKMLLTSGMGALCGATLVAFLTFLPAHETHAKSRDHNEAHRHEFGAN